MTWRYACEIDQENYVCPIESMPPETESAGLKEPPFVVPHHYSDIDHWKYPERNFYVFICLSVLLGFFGTDHFYLRSFGTATQKFLFNLVTFGMWYFWDLVQIFGDPKRVHAEGLNGPFDWIRGIGRGVFIDPVKRAAEEKEGTSVVRTKKDFVIYALLTIFCGIFGLDKFYIGEPIQGLTKFATTWFPLTFLFGWMWIFYDIIHTVFYPDSIVHGVISAPPPYNIIFGSGISGEPLFMPEKVSKAEIAKETAAAKNTAVSSGSGGFAGADTFRFLYRELAVPMLQPTVGTAIQQVDHGVKVTDKAVAVGNEVVSTVPKVAAAVSTQIQTATNPDHMMQQIQAAAAAKAAAPPASAPPVTAAPPPSAPHAGGGQRGGAYSSSGPIIAGTLSAVVITGAVKMISELLSDKKR